MRPRMLSELRDDAYKRSDNEGADEDDGRHPAVDVDRYINQGRAEFRDLLIEARGSEFLRADAPETITTTEDTTSYELPEQFYLLISVRLQADSFSEPLVPFNSQEEPRLRDTNATALGYPTHYQLRRTSDGTSSLAVLPEHDAGLSIIVDYVPALEDLEADDDTDDGINGWEAYVVDYAAREMAIRDQEWDLVKVIEGDMARMRERIMRLAPRRDMHRARRVKDVRGARLLGRPFR